MSTNDRMGTENIKKLLFRLAIPAVVAQVVNLLYNIVDRIYIGHMAEVGASALTGVGLFMPILMLINAFAMLSGAGGAPLAAISMGKKDNGQAEKIMGSCFAMLILLACILTPLFYVAAPTLLQFFGASETTMPYALSYARIYILGTVFVLIVMGMNPFITTQGFAAFSMLTTVFGAVINIILDPLLIFTMNMGVTGAALASIMSQAIAAVWIIFFLSGKKTILHLQFRNIRLQWQILKKCIALGISSFVMLSTESLLSISFTSSLQRYGGDVAVGAMTIITSVNQLVSMPIQGICQGGQPIISYNYGAGNSQRVKDACKTMIMVSFLYALVFWCVVQFFPQVLVRLFTSDASLMDMTVWAIRIYMAVTFTQAFQISCQQGFVAMGQAKISLFLACLRKLILLIPLIMILPHFVFDQVFAVFLAEPISDFIAAAVTAGMFFTKLNAMLEYKM